MFDVLELKIQAYYGSRQAERALSKRMAELKNALHLGGGPGAWAKIVPSMKPELEKRQVDKIGTEVSPLLTDASTTTKLAVLGVGVDLMYLPRMRGLVSRHAQRLACHPWSGSLTQVPRIAKAQPQDEKLSQNTLLAVAAQHFANRTLSQTESKAWYRGAPAMKHEDRLRFLATR